MTPLDAFTTAVGASTRHRGLMARAALNMLGFEAEFPVDVSELRALSGQARGLLLAFTSWAVGQPHPYERAAELHLLRSIASKASLPKATVSGAKSGGIS